jgi:hypothetical protein
LLRRENLPDLIVSWKEGHVVFKTHSHSLGQMRLDPSQVSIVNTHVHAYGSRAC